MTHSLRSNNLPLLPTSEHHGIAGRGRTRSRCIGSLVFLLTWMASWGLAHAVGNAMFDIGTNTGQKPQSKIWYHDGSYWAILDGPNGIAFYEKVGSNWDEGAFVDAILTSSSGAADVKWSGTNLFVLIYSSSPKLYKYTYDSGGRAWNLLSGFPVSVPNPSGSETMTIDQDSTGRLWATAEGGGDVNVYYTTTADHQSWSSSVVLQSGLNADDITAIIAFGGNKIGVFWSDQSSEEYGFRVHNDADSPTSWSSIETVDSGSGVADDHLNLATDSTGRVWCSTKNASDELQMHRRSTSGSWTSQQDVSNGSGTRSIVMVNEDDDLLYLVYTNWDTDPRSVYYRTSSLSSLSFGSTTAFMTHGSLAMNNPTGMKQVLPTGSLMALATLDESEAWWNGFGSPPAGNGPTPPTNLVATLQGDPAEVALTWSQPSSGAPDGYNIYRQVDGGSFVQINGSLVGVTSFTDTTPPADLLCYRVTAETSSVETAASNTDCVDNSPPLPPAAPDNLVATLQQNPDEVSLTWDEPTTGAPDGYNIYRQVDGGSFVQINGSLVTSLNYTDTAPPQDALCYEVTAETSSVETAASNTECVDNTPPTPPTNLVASLQQMPDEVSLTWDEPTTGAPDGYNIYRQVDSGSFVKINGSLVTTTDFTDTSPPADTLCYEVTAETNSVETAASNAECVDNSPPLPPDAPENLSLTQVDPGSTSRLLGLLLDEGSGLQVNDFSGHGHHGWLGNDFAADAADPTHGSAAGRDYLTFDGTDDRVEIPDAPLFDLTGSFTLEAWVRPAVIADAVLIEKGAATERTFSLRMTNAGEVTFSWSEAGVDKSTTSPSQLSSGNWVHLAGVYDAQAGENRIYVDGLLVQTGNALGIPHANDAAVLIGAAADSTAHFSGDIDEMHVFADAVYDVNFIAPQKTQPLTADASRFDNSSLDIATAGLPTVPKIHSGGAGVQLQWDAPSAGVTAASYNIYRTVDNTTEQLNATPLLQTTFLDADSLLGWRSYEISAVSSLGLEGITTAPESIDVAAPVALALAPEQVLMELFDTPPAYTDISWVAPTQGTSPMGYHVYRSDSGAFPQRVTTAPIVALQFTDSTLTAGDLCYSVRSILADGREGVVSTDDCAFFTPLQLPTEPLFFVVAADSTPQGPASGVAAYRMNEGSGQTLEDATDNGHTGTLGNSPDADSADPIWVAGISGNALQFDGSNDFAEVADAIDLQIAGSFTVEAWFQLTGSGDHAILSKGGSQKRNYWIIIEAGGVIDFRWETSGGANHGAASSAVVTDSNWHHVACVYDMGLGENRIYLDGTLVEQAADSGVPATSTDPFYIGGRISSSSLKDYFEGTIDLVRVSSSPIYIADFTPPTDYSAPGASGAMVNLSWQAPANGYTSDYRIYRSVDGGAWSVLDSLITELSYVDATLDSVGPLVCYQISGVDGAGQEGILSPPVCIGSSEPTSVWEQPTTLATLPIPGIRVGPNPFNPNVRIQFDIARATHARLRIFDVRGRLVVSLLDDWVQPGLQSHIWNGRSTSGHAVASGSYFVLLQATDRSERRKITLVR